MRLIWNEKYNILALYEKFGALGKIIIIDDDFSGTKDFTSYPLKMLIDLGYWTDLGEL